MPSRRYQYHLDGIDTIDAPATATPPGRPVRRSDTAGTASRCNDSDASLPQEPLCRRAPLPERLSPKRPFAGETIAGETLAETLDGETLTGETIAGEPLVSSSQHTK